MNLLKNVSKRTLLIGSFAGFGLFLVITILFILKGSAQNGSSPHNATASIPPKQQPAKQQKSTSRYPVRLKIPKINVNAALDYVVLTPKGELGAPKTPANAGWYVRGPRPGEKGSSVIDGHFGYRNHIPAVFDNLYKLQEGDNLYVDDEKGATITFVVRKLQTYGPNDDATDVFRSSDREAHLNLITCKGDWNEAQKSYSNRLVVFADKEPE